MNKCFIGQTEITVDAVQLDLIINALGYYSSWKAEHRFTGIPQPVGVPLRSQKNPRTKRKDEGYSGSLRKPYFIGISL